MPAAQDFVLVKVYMQRSSYNDAVKARKKAGLPSVGAHILEKAGYLNKDGKAEELCRKAFDKTKKLTPGTEFLLSSLFPKKEWSGFDAGTRVSAGKLFYARALRAGDNVSPVKKVSGGHQKYRRN